MSWDAYPAFRICMRSKTGVSMRVHHADATYWLSRSRLLWTCVCFVPPYRTGRPGKYHGWVMTGCYFRTAEEEVFVGMTRNHWCMSSSALCRTTIQHKIRSQAFQLLVISVLFVQLMGYACVLGLLLTRGCESYLKFYCVSQNSYQVPVHV